MDGLYLLSVFINFLLSISATPVCVYKNTFYISDTEIFEAGCNVAYCDKMAQLVYREGCSTTTGAWPSTTMMPTTMPTTMIGCYYNGKFYHPNSQIYRGEDRDANWCYSAYCDSTGQVIHGDNFNCFPTTLPTTTAPTTIPPLVSTNANSGCFYNGKFYPANTNLGAPNDRATKYCTKCDENGHLQHWYDFDCFRDQTTLPTDIVG